MHTESMKSAADIFYYNFNRLLQERGYSQTDFSDASGIAPSTVSLYATGKRTPGAESLQRLAEFFKVSAADFYKTPAELLKERNAAIASGEPRRIGNTSKPYELQKAVDGLVKEGFCAQFSLNVTTDDFHPYAVDGDELCCMLPFLVSDGQMVLLRKNGALLMGRVYDDANGYLFVSEKRSTFPVAISAKDKNTSILAVVLYCKHPF